MSTTSISNRDDTIDSRYVIARIEELEGERDAWNDDESTNWAEENESDADELANLKSLAEDAEGYAPDWRYGTTLIRDSYFEDYAEQMAEDIGAIDRNARWPLNHIDWSAAAEALKQDYTSVEFDGVTYWLR